MSRIVPGGAVENIRRIRDVLTYEIESRSCITTRIGEASCTLCSVRPANEMDTMLDIFLRDAL